MDADSTRLHAELDALGARIESKLRELHKQCVLHGPAREEAAELQMRHARLQRAAHAPPGRLIADEIAGDIEILKHSFTRWLARIDKDSERPTKS